MKRVIIVGATSGIGRALASLYVADGWTVGLCGGKAGLLEEMQDFDPDTLGQCSNLGAQYVFGVAL